MILAQELKLNWRQKQVWLYPGLFLILVIILFGLVIPADKIILLKIIPGIYWITITLSTLLSAQSIFREELAEGMLEQYLLSEKPLWEMMAIKLLSQSITIIIPCLFFTILFVYAFNLPEKLIYILWGVLLLSIPALQALSAVMGLLTISMRNNTGLLAVLILPLIIPVLILAVSITQQALLDLPFAGQLAWLAILSIFSVSTMPFAMAAALRIAIWMR